MTAATEPYNPLSQPGEHGMRLGMQFLGGKIPWERSHAEGWHKGAFVQSPNGLFVAIIGKDFNWPAVWSNGSAPENIGNGSIWLSLGVKGRRRYDVEFAPSTFHGLDAVVMANKIYEHAERVVSACRSDSPQRDLEALGISWSVVQQAVLADDHPMADDKSIFLHARTSHPLPPLMTGAVLDQVLNDYTLEHRDDPGMQRPFRAAPALSMFPTYRP